MSLLAPARPSLHAAFFSRPPSRPLETSPPRRWPRGWWRQQLHQHSRCLPAPAEKARRVGAEQRRSARSADFLLLAPWRAPGLRASPTRVHRHPATARSTLACHPPSGPPRWSRGGGVSQTLVSRPESPPTTLTPCFQAIFDSHADVSAPLPRLPRGPHANAPGCWPGPIRVEGLVFLIIQTIPKMVVKQQLAA